MLKRADWQALQVKEGAKPIQLQFSFAFPHQQSGEQRGKHRHFRSQRGHRNLRKKPLPASGSKNGT